MRVIAGEARSLPLKTPAGDGTRPTTDRIKETLFNILQPYLADAVFIDAFSGSGGIGIEAISRGAKRSYFIETDQKALSCIRDNINFTGFSDRSVILAGDALFSVNSIHEKADIIFMDPPYGAGFEKELIKRLKDAECVSDQTLIIAETLLNEDFSFVSDYGFEVTKIKKYKTNQHVFLYKKIEE